MKKDFNIILSFTKLLNYSGDLPLLYKKTVDILREFLSCETIVIFDKRLKAAAYDGYLKKDINEFESQLKALSPRKLKEVLNQFELTDASVYLYDKIKINTKYIYTLPIVTDNKVSGYIILGYQDIPAEFEDEKELLLNLLTFLSTALNYNKKFHIEKKIDELAVLNTVNDIIEKEIQNGNVFEKMLPFLARKINLKFIVIYSVEEGMTVPLHKYKFKYDEIHKLKKNVDFSGQLQRCGEFYIGKVFNDDLRIFFAAPSSAPLKNIKLVQSIIKLVYRQLHFHSLLYGKIIETEEDKKKLQYYSEKMKKLNRNLKYQLQYFKTMYDISFDIAKHIDLTEVLHSIVNKIDAVMSARRVSIMLAEKNILKMKAAVNISKTDFEEIEFKVGEGVCGYAAATKEPVIVENINKDKRFKALPVKIKKFKSMVSVPLVYQGALLGVLNVDRNRKFNKDEIDLILTISRFASIIINNAKVYDEVCELTSSTITSLAAAVEAKDSYTQGHSERVARIAKMIAREIGLSAKEIQEIEDAARLHDIGKIGVPLTILQKKSRLTKEEYDIIKDHSKLGAEIIRPIRKLKNESMIIKLHHERYDGKGYIEGLKGKEIPIGARIIALADSFDAMTTVRPYKRTKSLDEAVKEIIKCSGTQFDPELVNVFLKMLADEKTKEKFLSISSEPTKADAVGQTS